MGPDKNLPTKIEKPVEEVTPELVSGPKEKSPEERIANTKKIVEFTRYLLSLTNNMSPETLREQLKRMESALDGKERIDPRDDPGNMKNVTP